MSSSFLSLFLMMMLSLSDSSQTTLKGSHDSKLTYYYIGEGCPFCNDHHPERKFGFMIQCTGCVMNDKIENNNSTVIKKLDKEYGEGWTLNYIANYCDSTSK